jgi:hypothetical protein
VDEVVEQDEVVVQLENEVVDDHQEVVIQGASEQSREDASKNLIARYPVQDLQRAGFRRPALARTMRAALAMEMQTAEKKGRKREIS